MRCLQDASPLATRSAPPARRARRRCRPRRASFCKAHLQRGSRGSSVSTSAHALSRGGSGVGEEIVRDDAGVHALKETPRNRDQDRRRRTSPRCRLAARRRNSGRAGSRRRVRHRCASGAGPLACLRPGLRTRDDGRRGHRALSGLGIHCCLNPAIAARRSLRHEEGSADGGARRSWSLNVERRDSCTAHQIGPKCARRS